MNTELVQQQAPTAVLASPAATPRAFSLTPTTLAEAMEFADLLARSSIVPKDFQGNPGNVLVAVQWGGELGLAPLQAMQSIAVVNGRPAIWGDAMIALVKGSGLLESIVEDVNDREAVCTVKRRGEASVSRTFTLEDAKRAGLTGKQGPWQQYPKRMLQMRARAWALRDVFPDVLRGVYVAEEARDMPAEKHMGAVEEVTPAAKPATRADAAAEALARRRSKAVPDTVPAGPVGETALSILDSIAAAETLEELAKAGEKAAQITDEEEKAKARAAYRKRLSELSPPPPEATIDPATGEIGATDGSSD